MLAIHEQLSKVDLNITQRDFDATSLYPSPMWEKVSVYSKIESGYASKSHMEDLIVNGFNNETFNQGGNDSAILRIKYYNPPNLIFQHYQLKKELKT